MMAIMVMMTGSYQSYSLLFPHKKKTNAMGFPRQNVSVRVYKFNEYVWQLFISI